MRRFSVDGDLTTFSGRAGIGNSLEFQRGSVWKALVQVARQQDDGGAYNATGQGADASGVYVKPINSNGVFAATSVLTRLDYTQFSGFLSGGVSASLTRFEDAELSNGSKLSQASRDTNSYTATGRIGWNVLPVAYTFLEPSVAWQQTPNVTDGDTTTYRLTAGLGTDRIDLVRGEIYAGIARQMFNDLSDNAKDGFVYGGRLSWLPTRDLTFNLNADDTLGVTAASNSGVTQVYLSRTKSVAADMSYQFDQRVTMALRTSFSRTEYTDTGRTDNSIRLGADMTYMVTGNFGIRFGYSNVSVDSSTDLNSFNRNVYVIGLNGRF